jgi:segregation and condensation protein B
MQQIDNEEKENQISENEIINYAKNEGLYEDTSSEINETEEGEVSIELDSEKKEFLLAAIEAVLFMSDKPIGLSKIRQVVDSEIPYKVFKNLMQELKQSYSSNSKGIDIVEINNGYQFRTKPQMASVLRKMVKTQPLKLTTTNMETLAIIAYKQPITKEEIDKLRGVDSGYMIRNLMEKRLIKIVGRSEQIGRPMLYGTTHEFLELFSLKSLEDLPPLHELEAMVAQSEVGEELEEQNRLKEFGQVILNQSTNLFEDNGLDEELEKIKSEIASISTTTEFLELQKEKEKIIEQLKNNEFETEEKRQAAESKLNEIETRLAFLTGNYSDSENDEEFKKLEQEISDAEKILEEKILAHENSVALEQNLHNTISKLNEESLEINYQSNTIEEKLENKNESDTLIEPHQNINIETPELDT